jgi:hypothetical protein
VAATRYEYNPKFAHSNLFILSGYVLEPLWIILCFGLFSFYGPNPPNITISELARIFLPFDERKISMGLSKIRIKKKKIKISQLQGPRSWRFWVQKNDTACY